MKFIAVLLVVCALVAVILAVPHHKEGHEGTTCDYHCENEKPLEKPISTNNGTCRREFANECELEMYNCVNHPEKQFEKEADEKSAGKQMPMCPLDHDHDHVHEHEHEHEHEHDHKHE